MMMRECFLGTGQDAMLVVLLRWPGLGAPRFCSGITKTKELSTLVSAGFSPECLLQVGHAFQR